MSYEDEYNDVFKVNGVRRQRSERKDESKNWTKAKDMSVVEVYCEGCNEHLAALTIAQKTSKAESYIIDCPLCGDRSPLTKVTGKVLQGFLYDVLDFQTEGSTHRVKLAKTKPRSESESEL